MELTSVYQYMNTPVSCDGAFAMRRVPALLFMATIATTAGLTTSLLNAQEPLRSHLADRGPGVPTSLFGTYIESGQWMLYPFLEYDKNSDEEYSPRELGYPQPGVVGDDEFFGESAQSEAVLFLGYGISESLAVEFEAELYASATFDKWPLDNSPVPARIKESGFAGAEAQLRWLWREETPERRAMYSYFEVELPFQDKKVLIGAQDFEFAVGSGFIRHYSWGTLNGRMSLAYDGEESKIELGEYAIEYLKRVNDRWRLVATMEGEDDEISLIGEGQLTLRPGVILKLNSGFGLTKKAADIAPEIGVLFTF
jgi:hypothetical protein